METRNVPIFLTIATITSKTSPWLGWEVLFDDLTVTEIRNFTPLVETCLNDYLKSNVNVTANKLVVPFNLKLVASGTNPQLYFFKVQVFRKILFFKFPFPYPPAPILAVNHFQLVKGPFVESQPSTVALKPPSPVN